MLTVRAHRAIWSDEVWLLVAEMDIDRRITAIAGGPLTMREHEPGMPIDEPTLRLCSQAAQRLMDELWSVGIRPSNGEGNAGQLGATEKHLEDMRRLVFEHSSKGGENG